MHPEWDAFPHFFVFDTLEVNMPWFIKTKSERETLIKSTDEIWVICKSCKAHIFKQDFFNNLHVCPKCNWHGKITAYERIGITLDSGSFKEINENISPADPLHFVDGKGPYTERVEQARIGSYWHRKN